MEGVEDLRLLVLKRERSVGVGVGVGLGDRRERVGVPAFNLELAAYDFEGDGGVDLEGGWGIRDMMVKTRRQLSVNGRDASRDRRLTRIFHVIYQNTIDRDP